MPVGKGGRFRVTTRGGKKIRLHFPKGSNKPDEAKNLKMGKTQPRAELRRDRRRSRRRK